jgi:hypothetical protein
MALEGTYAPSPWGPVVEGPERDEWWKRATEDWPSSDEYQTKTDRQIPVVVLDWA